MPLLTEEEIWTAVGLGPEQIAKLAAEPGAVRAGVTAKLQASHASAAAGTASATAASPAGSIASAAAGTVRHYSNPMPAPPVPPSNMTHLDYLRREAGTARTACPRCALPRDGCRCPIEKKGRM